MAITDDIYSLHMLMRTRSCLSFFYPMDCSPLGFSVHGIFQARILERGAISSSRESFQPRDRTCVSCVSYIGRQILYCCTSWGSLEKCGQFLLIVFTDFGMYQEVRSSHNNENCEDTIGFFMV